MKLRLVSEGAKSGLEIGRFVNIYLHGNNGNQKLICVFRRKNREWRATDPLKALQFSARAHKMIFEALKEYDVWKETEYLLEIPP